MNNIRVGGIIVTYNTGFSLINTYESIVNQVDILVFVDNGSDNITINLINKICSENIKCKIIANDINYGIAKALNQGIKYLMNYDVDFILTLDHDSIAENEMIKKMISIYEKLKIKYKIGILSPAIFDINKNDYLTCVNEAEYQLIKEPIQSGSLIKSDFIKEVGLYNEDLFIYYVDTDLCYRGIEKGYKMIQCNKVILNHEEGKKSEFKILKKKVYYNNYNEFAIYYRARNNIYMLKKYKRKFSSKDRLLKDAIKIIIFDKKRFKSLKAHFKGIFKGIIEKWDFKEVID